MRNPEIQQLLPRMIKYYAHHANEWTRQCSCPGHTEEAPVHATLLNQIKSDLEPLRQQQYPVFGMRKLRDSYIYLAGKEEDALKQEICIGIVEMLVFASWSLNHPEDSLPEYLRVKLRHF